MWDVELGRWIATKRERFSGVGFGYGVVMKVV